MKKSYTKPEIEIIYLETEDIITASGVVEDNDHFGEIDDLSEQIEWW